MSRFFSKSPLAPLAALLALSGSAPALASTYRWNVNASGSWTDPGNWVCESGCPGTFFTSAGDTAKFTTAITAARTVTIPTGVDVTVTRIVFDAGSAYTIAASGTGRLVLDAGAGSLSRLDVTNANGDGAHRITAPILVQNDPLQVAVDSSATLRLSGVLSGTPAVSFTSGTARIDGASANTNGGTVTVSGGVLELAKTGGVAPSGGGFVVGDDAGGVGADVLRLVTSLDLGAVQVRSSGRFDLDGQTSKPSQLSLLGAVGAPAQVSTGTGTLLLPASDVIAVSIFGTLTGRLDLRGVQGTLSIAAGAFVEPVQLTVDGVIANGSLKILGSGAVRFAGALANTYTGSTTVTSVHLQLGKTGGALSVPGPVVLQGGRVTLLQSNQIGDASSVSLDATSEFVLGAFSDVVGSLALETTSSSASEVAVASGALGLGGDVSVTATASGQTATISGGGTLDLGGGTRVFTVGANAALDVSLSVDDGGLTKTGPGPLLLSGSQPNAYTGPTTVTQGRLRLAKSPGVNAFGGALVVGDGSAGTQDEVVVETNEQIPNGATISVRQNAQLRVAQGVTESVGPLALETGQAGLSGAVVSLFRATLVLAGDVDVLVTGAGDGPVAFIGTVVAPGPSTLDLGGGTRTFTVADGAASVELGLGCRVANGSVVKKGPGTMDLAALGGDGNTYAGRTDVQEGALRLSVLSGGAALNGPLVVSGLVDATASNQFAGSPAVAIGATGRLEIAGSNSIGALTLATGAADAAEVALDSGATLALGGDVAVAGGGATGAAITGSGGAQLALGAATRTFTVADGPAASDLVVSPIVAGAAGLTKAGAGSLSLTGASTYPGTTTLNAGTLAVAGGSLASSVFGSAGTLVLSGGGAVGGVSLGGTAVLAPGGDGGSPVGTATGLFLSAGTTYRARLDGATTGQFSRVTVNGPVNVTGAALELTGAYAPAAGDRFTLVENDGTDAVTGTFASLPQGATRMFGGRQVRASYVSNSGNDVALDALVRGLFPLTPCRLVDTRNPNGPLAGPVLGAASERVFPLSSSACGVPLDAHAISVNVTAVSPAADGFLRMDRGDALAPGTSVVSFRVGKTRANNAITRISEDGQASLRLRNESLGDVHVVVDVNGYFR